MFEVARAAGASLGAHHMQPDIALQNAAIPAPLMLQKPQVKGAPLRYSIAYRCRKATAACRMVSSCYLASLPDCLGATLWKGRTGLCNTAGSFAG